jgi:hypothetical protein
MEHYAGSACRQLGGILKALRSAHTGGYLKTFEEIVAADVFSDFLSMSEHLLSAGYKDPAAVLVGATLEEHLRRLSTRAGAPTLDPDGRPLRADALNSELARRSIYRKLDQKNVTAWLGLRNHAAHGEFEAYESEQVKLMIDGVRVFLAQHP